MGLDRQGLTAEALLDAEEEVELAGRIEAGVLAREAREGGRSGCGASDDELALIELRGDLARQRFVGANLRLVRQVARQAGARSGMSEGDLFQEGCLGLMVAVERFDHRLGYRFSTYASHWVRSFVGAASAHLLGALNLPVSRAQQLRRLRGIEAQLTQTHGRPASPAEVAAWAGRSESWTAQLLDHQAPRSFEGLDLDVLAPTDGPGPGEDDDRPGAELLWHLDGLEREVLSLRFGFADGTAHTYAEIGRLLDLTVSRTRRLEHHALELLRAVCPQSASVYV